MKYIREDYENKRQNIGTEKSQLVKRENIKSEISTSLKKSVNFNDGTIMRKL